MTKYFEQKIPDSCWNKARIDEMLFILLARDAATAETIRFWAAKRIELGKNTATDPQIEEAMQCADFIDSIHRKTLNEKEPDQCLK